MLCTIQVVAQLIGEEPWFDVAPKQGLLPLKQLNIAPKGGFVKRGQCIPAALGDLIFDLVHLFSARAV